MKHTVCQKHNSDHYDELLTVYAAGNSSPQDRQRVEKLLAQCPGCRQKVMELEQTWWALDLWEQDERQVPLRLNSFCSRLREVKHQQPSWKRAFEQVSCFFRLSSFFRPAQWMPALSMASVIMVAAVLMYQPANTLFNTQELNNTQKKNAFTQSNQPVALEQAQSAKQSNPVQAAFALQTVAIHQPVKDPLSREDKFDVAVRNSASPNRSSGMMNNRNQYVQTAGFSPSKSIFSSFDMMEGDLQLQPGYIPSAVK